MPAGRSLLPLAALARNPALQIRTERCECALYGLVRFFAVRRRSLVAEFQVAYYANCVYHCIQIVQCSSTTRRPRTPSAPLRFHLRESVECNGKAKRAQRAHCLLDLPPWYWVIRGPGRRAWPIARATEYARKLLWFRLSQVAFGCSC